MRRLTATLLLPLAFAAACGGDDDTSVAPETGGDEATVADPGAQEPSGEESTGGAATGDTTSDTAGDQTVDGGDTASLPAECTAAPFDIELTIDALPEYAGAFTVTGAAGTATPIVPNGDGSLDDLDIAEWNELGAETDLLAYSQWIGDHEFGPDDVGFLGGPTPPTGAITLGLSVVPPTEDGLAAGDVVSHSDEIAYDAITTFGTVGAYFQGAEGVDTFFLVDLLDPEQGGTAEVLHVDDDWLCIAWDLAGETSNPEGTYTIRGTVLTPLERQTTPYS